MGNKLLLLLVAAMLAVGAFLLLGDPAPAPKPTEQAAPTATTPGAARSTDLALEPGANPLPGGSTDTEPTLRVEVAPDQRPAWATDETLELEGLVLLPPGSPADEELRLSVVTPEEDNGELDTATTYTVAVSAEGHFTLFLAPGSAPMELELEGRYLYLNEPFVVDPREPPVLRPVLGAWVSGQLVLPAGADTLDLTSTKISSTVDLGSGFNATLAGQLGQAIGDITPDASGAFELFSLPCDVAFAIAADATELPIVTLGDLQLVPGEHRELRFEFALGSALSGRVTDPEGAALEGVQFEATSGGQFDLQAQFNKRRAESNDQGIFRIPGLSAGKLHLSASKQGYLLEEELEFELIPGEGLTGVEIVLSHGASVSGRVFDEGGAPVTGAAVSLRFDPAALTGMNAANAQRGASGSALSGADGAFTISGLGSGPFLIEAESDGAAGGWMYGKHSGIRPGDDVTINLRAIAAFRGRVIDAAGKPIEAFELNLQAGSLGSMMAGNQINETVENPEGRFELEHVKDGSWNLYVSAAGLGRVGPIPADRPGPGDVELEIRMTRGVTARGQVFDPTGQPVAGATVTWQADAGDMVLNLIGVAPSISATTDNEGAFELAELPAGSLTLKATSPEWANAEPLSFDAEPDELVEDLRFDLQSGGSIAGKVLNDEGRAEVGALIQIQQPGTNNQTFTNTDDAGEFLAERLEAGKWQVIAIPGDTKGSNDPAAMLQNLKMDMVEVVNGETVQVLLGAPPENPVHVRGRVEPAPSVAGGLAIFIPEGKGMLGGMRMASIDESGRFELDLDKPGKYVVTIQNTPEGGIGQDSVEFQELLPEKDQVELVLHLPGGSISGRVTDSKGKLLAGIRVSLYSGSGTSTGTISGGKYTETTTDAAGTYRIEHLRAGRYTVGAGGRAVAAVFDDGGDYGREVYAGLVVPMGQELGGVDFELEGAGTIDGKVIDSNGKPVVGASLFVRNSEGVLLERISLATTGADGSFSYFGIAEGHYTISARSKSEVSAARVPVDVRSGESSTVELALAAGTVLEVSVVDADGEPLSARLEVLDSSGRDVAGQFGMTDLTELLAGDFSTTTQRFGPLPPGKYKVTGVSGTLSGKKPVTLSGQERRRIKLRLK